MTVDIKGESGGRVTKIALHGFDVITGADEVHGVGMAKIVYPCVGKADAFHDMFSRSALTYSALTYFALKYDISVSDLRGAV